MSGNYIIAYGGQLWVGDSQARRILRFDPDTNQLRWWSLRGSAFPKGLAFDADGRLWWADAQALARKHAQADEEQLLIWLAEKRPGLAEFMRALRSIPEEEQQGILEAMASDMRAIHSGEALRIKGSIDE